MTNELSVRTGKPRELHPTQGPPKWREAPLYVPSEDLMTALDLALALGMPLLITGAPGTGKTAAAYWAGWKLGLDHDRIIHEPVRSTSTSDALKYRFDSIGYFREAQVSSARDAPVSSKPLHKDFILPGPLWQAYEASENSPVVLLLDEIDKAPRDLPNDLLYDVEEGRFDIPELALDDAKRRRVERKRGKHPILCVMTSNGERDLPSPFLRRCLHHHVHLDSTHVETILRRRETELELGDGLLTLAVRRFEELRKRRLDHTPDLAEYLVWLRALRLQKKLNVDSLKNLALSEIDCASALIKTPTDHSRLRQKA